MTSRELGLYRARFPSFEDFKMAEFPSLGSHCEEESCGQLGIEISVFISVRILQLLSVVLALTLFLRLDYNL